LSQIQKTQISKSFSPLYPEQAEAFAKKVGGKIEELDIFDPKRVYNPLATALLSPSMLAGKRHPILGRTATALRSASQKMLAMGAYTDNLLNVAQKKFKNAEGVYDALTKPGIEKIADPNIREGAIFARKLTDFYLKEIPIAIQNTGLKIPDNFGIENYAPQLALSKWAAKDTSGNVVKQAENAMDLMAWISDNKAQFGGRLTLESGGLGNEFEFYLLPLMQEINSPPLPLMQNS